MFLGYSTAKSSSISTLSLMMSPDVHIIPASQYVSSLTVLTPALCPRCLEHQSSC
jgi:hypothetical protein